MASITLADLTTLLTAAGIDPSVIIIRSDPLTIVSIFAIEERLPKMFSQFYAATGLGIDVTDGPWSIVRGAAWFAAIMGKASPEGPYAIGQAIISTGAIDTYFLVACVYMSGTPSLAFYSVVPTLDETGRAQVAVTFTTSLTPADATQVTFQ